MAWFHSYDHGPYDIDSGGNCKAPGCFYNTEAAHGAGVDMYDGHVPELTEAQLKELREWYPGRGEGN